MVEGNQETHHGTRVVHKPPGEPDSQQVAGSTPQGEHTPVEGDGTYQGAGFSGRRLGEPALTPQPNQQTSVEHQASASQGTPPTFYCPSCNVPMQLLPNGQLWCSRCNAAVVVGGGNPIVERLQGFACGFLLSIIGVIAVALLSHPSKQGNRLLGALGGMIFWLGLMWYLGAFDPWLAQYGLNAHECYATYDGITCTGPWSPQ